MSPGRRNALIFGAVAAGAAAAGLWLGAGDKPDLLDSTPFTDLQGRARKLAEWRGKPVVVNFWATWCAPCREEIPMLAEARNAGAGRFEVVGIAIDNAPKVAEYAANYRISYPVLVAGGEGLDLIRQLGNKAGGLPFTVFLDRDGTPVQTRLGALKRAELDGLLAGLLG